MRNYHEHDVKGADWNEYEGHASDCPCDACSGAYDHEDAIPAPSEAELERMYAYELARKRSA